MYHGTKRKVHCFEAGYVSEHKNPYFPKHKVVIYVAEEQGIDVGPDKYAVVCDLHGTLAGTNSLRNARVMMRWPINFCEACGEECRKHDAFIMEEQVEPEMPRLQTVLLVRPGFRAAKPWPLIGSETSGKAPGSCETPREAKNTCLEAQGGTKE